MGSLFRRAEDILNVALSGDGVSASTAIILEGQGGVRILDASGWSLPALRAEFGASAIFKVERHGLAVRVEAWDGRERCLLERRPAGIALLDLPGIQQTAITPQPCALLAQHTDVPRLLAPMRAR